MKLTVRELAKRLGCPYEGDGELEISGCSSLEGGRAGAGDLVFLAPSQTASQARLRPLLEATAAGAAILPPGEAFDRLPVIRSENPHLAFIRAVEIFHRPFRPAPGVHPTAAVSPTAKLAPGVSIGALSVVGDEAEIGPGTVIFPLVSIYPRVRIGADCLLHSGVVVREDVRIGDRVVLHNGVSVGADGYGYLRGPDGGHLKIPQVGTVVIEDDVEIGANSAVDRAALGETVIRKGAKIDDLVMVAHNVEVGENALLVAQVGIGGSSKIGRGAILGGQVGVPDHIDIGEGAIAAAKSGITNDIPAGGFVSGSPHLDVRVWRKFWAAAPQLYGLLKEFKRLRARVEELEAELARLKNS
ncbi:MAG: UDP-3-O-(3-hydroxymyristoyl)glucosamine N-acyltransferase [Candidatus Aminicenantes bacterium]|nr:UDP-3-O-(3-hydroxymyristoyl)glucosamine N-acyltransferase [Candidatus Aminicenantes bacterium]